MQVLENRPILNPTNVGASVFNVSGLFGDNWCEPRIRFSLGASSDLTICQLEVWLMGNERQSKSSFSVWFDNRDPFKFDVPHGTPVSVQVACPCAAGETMRAEIQCTNVVENPPGDLRTLSFQLLNVRFS